MKVTVSPYHRSVTIDGVEVRQKMLEFPNALNHLASISCTYDKDSNTVVELSDMHRYASHFTEREYFNKHLPEFVTWYYAEKQAQIEEEARLQKYKEDVENAINLTVEAGKEAQANIATDKKDALDAIAASKQDAITSIQGTEEGILENITTVGNNTLAAINSGKNTALSEIVNTRINAITSINQLKNETVTNITSLKNDAIQSINSKKNEAEASIEAYRQSAQDAVNATGKRNQAELDDKGIHYLNQTKEQVELAKEQADRAKEAADRATAIADIGPATRDRLGLVKIGRGLEVNEEGLIEVRSSITMLAPIVEAPDVLPLGYNSVFNMQAYPGLGKTSIKQYRCTLENVGTQIIDANTETGAGTVTFVVPKAMGENRTLKLTVIAIDTLDNESLPTELSRLTARAFVNPPIISSPNTDSIIYPLEGFTATSEAFRTTALADTHEFTDWVIAKDNQANVIVVDIKNTTDLYSHTFTREELANKVFPNQTYYVFARHHGTILGVSELGSYKGIHAKSDIIKAPVISSPEALDTVYPAAGFIAETNSEFETIGTADTHVSTDWYITSDKEGKNIVASCLGSTDLKTHKFTPTELHNLEEQLYYVFCRFNGRIIGAGQTSDSLTVIAREAYIKAPILNQKDYASVYPTGGIELSTNSIFESFGITDDTHKDTDWFIYQREDGTGIIAQALHSADLYSHTFPANLLTRMEIGKVYYVAARFNGEKIETGRLSAIEAVATKGSYIHAPTIYTPVSNQDVYRAAGFTVTTNSVFKTTGVTDEHISSDWIISRDVDGLDIVVSAMNSEDLTSHTFTSDDIQDLEIGESYYILMRFNGNIITKGNTSEAVKVTVQSAAIKAPVINNLEDGTNCYYLGGLEVSTNSEFETIGLDSDEHISSDWIIAKDSAGKQVLAQVIDSSDLKSHFFSADNLEGMVDETDYYVFCRFNGAIITKGILSNPIRIVAKPAGVLATEIVTPVANSKIAFSAGVTITGSTFETIGVTDTHASSDYKLTRDAAGQDVICQVAASSDLTSHTFAASEIGELTEGDTYYAWVRYNGATLGNGIWSSVAWEAMLGIMSPNGDVFIYRHSSDKASVMEFEAFGYKYQVLVADAAFRKKLAWGQYNIARNIGVQNPAPDASVFWYGKSQEVSNVLPSLTITNLLANSDFGFTLNNTPACRDLCDQWLQYKDYTDGDGVKGVPPVEYARSLTNIVPDGCDIATPFLLAIIYKESDVLDSLDPTVEANLAFKLGRKGNSGFRWEFDASGKCAISACEKDYRTQWAANFRGCMSAVTKPAVLGVLPIRELSVEPIIYEFAGRKIYRHESGKGSVIEYNEFGTPKKLFVADAVYRGSAQWKTSNAAVSGLQRWRHIYYPTCTDNVIDSNTGYVDLSQVADLTPYSAQLSDAYFQAALTATLAPVIQTAKAATDLMIADGNCPAAKFVRGKTSAVGIEMQLPNIYQLLVMYACGDIIDSIDPTVAANRTKALGKYDTNTYRWYIGGQYGTWSSTEFSDIQAGFVFDYGYMYYYSKNNTFGVTPVAEID